MDHLRLPAIGSETLLVVTVPEESILVSTLSGAPESWLGQKLANPLS